MGRKVSEKLAFLVVSLTTHSLKKYEEKLLVVVNPWPPSGPKHPQFINNVSSWFEIMLRMDNKGMKVEAVYQQKTVGRIPAAVHQQYLTGATYSTTISS